MTRTPTRIAATAVSAVAAFALTAPSAQAEVFDHFTFDFSDQETFDDCGFTIVNDITISGNNVIRTVHDTQTLFFSKLTYRSEEVLTNPSNGKWFRVTANQVSREGGPVEQVSPGVYTYTVREAGAVFAIWDSSGRLVEQDRGLLTSRITFDTGGDDVPGGEELDYQLVSINGPHPLFDADFCAIANDLIG